MNTICKAIEDRYSCRCFDNNKIVPVNVVNCLLRAGSMAPSGKNLQPWRFKVLNNASFSETLSNMLVNNKWTKSVNQFILVFIDKDSSYNTIKDSMAIGAAIENILIEARFHSVDTCWIGECLEHCEKIKVLLNIDPRYEVMAIIAIGYSRKKLASPTKKAIDDLLL